MSNVSFGKSGEEKARKYLKKKGYRILRTNFKTQLGEIDIIAEHQGCIVFIEVKSRSGSEYGLPREAVGFAKQKRYSQLAMQYIKAYNLFGIKARFDVIEVTSEGINHIENAFEYINA
jgi:putative endonuclease